jgi:hypothetical protein
MTVVGCASRRPSPEQPPVTVPVVPTTGLDPAELGDPATRCRELLVRFGPRAAEHEQGPCVTTVTTGDEKTECAARGLGDDFVRCFDGCMQGVGLSEADYDVSDPSTSPVDNCRLGCLQTNCGR